MDKESIKQWLTDKNGYCDSLSCLHALEHFGLGRYCDSIDASGFVHGLRNLSSLLKPNGKLYLSTPMGAQRVEFNANWVFAPQTIFEVTDQCSLRLEKLHTFEGEVGFIEHPSTEWSRVLESITAEYYRLVIMEFIKVH